jgi:hypothetical protein
MKYEPTVTYKCDDSVPKEEAERRVAEAYDILFRETVKMMEKSSNPEDIAFLEKFPWMKEGTRT